MFSSEPALVHDRRPLGLDVVVVVVVVALQIFAERLAAPERLAARRLAAVGFALGLRAVELVEELLRRGRLDEREQVVRVGLYGSRTHPFGHDPHRPLRDRVGGVSGLQAGRIVEGRGRLPAHLEGMRPGRGKPARNRHTGAPPALEGGGDGGG